MLGDFSEHGKLWKFSGNYVQPLGKIVTNKVFLVFSFKYLCKKAVDWVNKIIRNRRGQSAVVTCYIAGVDVE